MWGTVKWSNTCVMRVQGVEERENGTKGKIKETALETCLKLTSYSPADSRSSVPCLQSKPNNCKENYIQS